MVGETSTASSVRDSSLLNAPGRNIEIVRRMFSAMEKSAFDDLDEFIAPDYFNHESIDDGRSDLRGPAEFMKTAVWLRTAFGPLHFEEQEILATGNQVFIRVIMRGKHVGEFFGNKPTGRKIQHQQWHLFDVAHGKIVSHRAMRDDLGLMKQIRGAQS
jgi:predicted ester cyclase